METRLRAAVIAGCKESLRLEAASRDGAAAEAEEGSLPGQRKHIAPSEGGTLYFYIGQEG